MKRKARCILFATLISVFLFGITASANDVTDQIQENEIIFKENIDGKTANTIEELFAGEGIGNQVNLSVFKIIRLNNGYAIHGRLVYDNNSIDFETKGNLYKNEKTENAATFENLVLGEVEDCQNIHFVQLKMDKDFECMDLILQLKDTKQLIQFSFPISENEFAQVYNNIVITLEDIELEEKIVNLYSVSNNLINEDTDMEESDVQNVQTKGDVATCSYTGWKTLIDDLNNKGSVTLSNYSGIKAAWFKGGGWNHEHIWTSAPYSISIYSTSNGPDEYLSQFAMLDVVKQFHGSAAFDEMSSIKTTALQLTYRDGMLVRYNAITDKLSVMYYSFGVQFKNVKVGIRITPPEAYFINRTVSGEYEERGNFIRATVALFGTVDNIVSMFEYLLPYEQQKVDSKIDFDEDAYAQCVRYGEIIHGIAADTYTGSLTKTGHKILVEGEIRYINELTFDSYGEYSYTTQHNL